MSREIKFRAFSKSTKKIYNVVCVDFFKKEIIVNDIEEAENSHWIDLKNFELFQFTGMYDKNGKEIYEGDIVEKNGTFAKVLYCNSNAAFFTKAGVFNFYFGWDISQKDIMVVGNIYENSDLLS